MIKDYDFFLVAALRRMYQVEYTDKEIDRFIESFSRCYFNLKNKYPNQRQIKDLELVEELNKNLYFLNDTYVENIKDKVLNSLSKEIKGNPTKEDFNILYIKVLEYALPRQTYIISCMEDWTNELLNILTEDTKKTCIEYIKEKQKENKDLYDNEISKYILNRFKE